jgi:ribosomal protein S18 acetylase RimI-like enzyme
MPAATLECRRLVPGMEPMLSQFLGALAAAGDQRFFHPHPFTAEEVQRLTHYDGDDLYYALCVGGRILAYGMLRGWDEGFEDPSLGIAVRPDARGVGLGRTLMLFLHAAARLRGARHVRLKVYTHNEAAVSLYRSLGYKFMPQGDGQSLCLLDLSEERRPA